MDMQNTDPYLIPDWAPQQAAVLAWPHAGTDWRDMLGEIEKTYFSLVEAIVPHQPLVILARSRNNLTPRLGRYGAGNIREVEVDTNDTWVRDYMPLWLRRDDACELLDFGFNAWGGKFPYEKDNAVAEILYKKAGLFDRRVGYRDLSRLVLEGGSIETDGRGTIITTERCLCSGTRNPHLTKREIENLLHTYLHVRNIWWLPAGYIEGDDTDGHVDTLVRFCGPDTIAYASSENEKDIHFRGLKQMEEALIRLVEDTGRNYRLIPVPMPDPMWDGQGRRLPATYLNFTILNGAVLVPVYGCTMDEQAIEVLAPCFPHREMIGIYAGTLIKQGGSVHCATAQIPEGCLGRI